MCKDCLEDAEDLLGRVGSRDGLVLDDVEADSLGKRAALSDGDDISLLDGRESGGQVGRDVAVTLLETSVLGDEVKVITTEDDGALHLVGNNNSTEDTSTDRDSSGPGALVVDVLTVDRSSGSLNSQADVLVPSGATSALGVLGLDHADSFLLLECLLSLNVHVSYLKSPTKNHNSRRKEDKN